MFRLGILLVVLGFGSAIMHFTEVQFKLLVWAEPAQPVLGLLLGIGGLASIGFGAAASNKAKGVRTQPHHGQGQAMPPQQYGPPPGQPYGAPQQPSRGYGPPHGR